MKEIEVKDLNLGLLKKRTKAELLRMICHVANIANEYTPAGTGAIGDRALGKLNLTRPRFEIRFKEDIKREKNIAEAAAEVIKECIAEKQRRDGWEPTPGYRAKIIDGSTFWAPGKVGTVLGKMEGGWEVKVNYADGFNGETTARDHIICAYKLEPPPPEAQSPTNEPATKGADNPS